MPRIIFKAVVYTKKDHNVIMIYYFLNFPFRLLIKKGVLNVEAPKIYVIIRKIEK